MTRVMYVHGLESGPTGKKAKLLAEILNHELTHGRCTKTFLKKVRKQVRPAG